MTEYVIGALYEKQAVFLEKMCTALDESQKNLDDWVQHYHRERTHQGKRMYMSKRNKLAFLTSILSFLFLLPGVYLSMLTIKTSGALEAPIAGHMGISIFNTSNSILKTVQSLFERDYYFVSCMIFLFSVMLPVVKGVLLIYTLLSKNPFVRRKIFTFIKSVGKWSMCDVFIAATFLAYLSTGSGSRHASHETTLLGMPVDIDVFIKMTAQLEVGFYCFLAYCILSLIALQLYEND